MEFITYRFSLDARKSGCQKTLQGFTNVDKRARRLAVTINSNGDTLEIDKEHTSAVMYVTPHGRTTPSINECTIEGNTIFYNILENDIVNKGITKMQLKLIRGSADTIPNAQNVIASPSFQLEVLDTNTSDDEALLSPQFTALEKALAQAEAVAGHALYSIEFDEDFTFRAYYKDGTEYENDTFTILKDFAGTLIVEVEDAIAACQTAKADIETAKTEAERYIESEKTVATGDIQFIATSATDQINNKAKEATDNIHETSEAALEDIRDSVAVAVDSSYASKSYAVGGTGTREGEDTDNAKYYCEQAKAAVPTGGTVYGVKGEAEETFRSGNVSISKDNLGLSKVENKSSTDILAELTKQGVINALGYEPPKQDTTYDVATASRLGLVKVDNDTILIDADGTIHGASKIDIATPTTVGTVKPDNDTITIDPDGTLHGASSKAEPISKDEYDSYSEEKKMDGTVYYVLDEARESVSDASMMTYDDTVSGLGKSVQDAIDNANDKIEQNAEDIGELNDNLSELRLKKNSTFTLANTSANGSVGLLDDFRNYNFLNVILVTSDNYFLSSIYIPTEIVEDGAHLYPSYTSDSQIVVYVDVINGRNFAMDNNGGNKRVIIVGIDRKLGD